MIKSVVKAPLDSPDMTITGKDIILYRARVLKIALLTHVRTGGRVKVTRTATPSRLLRIAEQITGAKYKRGQYHLALHDIQKFLDNSQP